VLGEVRGPGGGLLGQWTADVQRRSDERAARWQERQREKARTGHMTLLDRWAARAQRKADEHAAEWEQRQREKGLSGRVTFMDRRAAHAQRKSDEAAARWLEIAPIMKLLASCPVTGPSEATAVIYVQATGFFLDGRRVTKRGAVVRRGGVVVSSGGGRGGAIVGAGLFIHGNGDLAGFRPVSHRSCPHQRRSAEDPRAAAERAGRIPRGCRPGYALPGRRNPSAGTLAG
jgi:hypothetical protein